ncbi:hypothetical protein [Burkholderia ubonensis]|uniref:hypothetical protein n=1 Tax=Burkholderia ubonensis TaxID=101571 RepID=UPI000A8667AD|nr:hypothetical protein [Burkholderia ubonensis]
MAQSHLIALPAQELSALLRASNALQLASLFVQIPASRAVQLSSVDDAWSSPAESARGVITEYEGGLL